MLKAYKEDFEIRQSFKFAADNYESAILKVIVNEDDYNVEKILNRIKNYYNRLNREVNRLEIILYDSVETLDNSEGCISRVYFKEKIQ